MVYPNKKALITAKEQPMNTTNTTNKIGFAEYRMRVEREAFDLINELEDRKVELKKEASFFTDDEDFENVIAAKELEDIDIQLEELEKSIAEHYKESFRDNPKDILQAIKATLPSCDVKSFQSILKIRKQFYENLLTEYENEKLPMFADYFKKSCEENFATFYVFVSDNIKTELEVAKAYGYGEDAEKLVFDYVSKYYKQEIPAYEKVLNAPATNALGLLPNRKMDTDPATGDMHAVITSGKHNIVFTIDNTGSNLPAAQADKVFDAFIRKLSKSVKYKDTPEGIWKARSQVLSVKEYMELCGLSDAKSAKEQLAQSLQWLYHVSAEWEETVYDDFETGKRLKTPVVHHWQARIFDSIGEDKSNPVKRGKMYVKFNPDIVTNLSYGYVAEKPTALFRINQRINPNSYQIGTKLALHKNMNLTRPNENRIGVRTLLESLPNIPSYDEVMQGSRHITRKIIAPFERDLFALVDDYGVCEDIHYCNSKGIPLTDEQLSDYGYDEWINWYVEFTLKDYPEQAERRREIAAVKEEKRKLKAKRKAKRG